MAASVESILDQLSIVERERAAREEDPQLARQVHALKRYQQRRFTHTYADLLADPQYVGAARFFLDELYGPGDFSQRDAQFARVVPTLVRLFPQDVVETVACLAQLHALSEELDTATARHLPNDGEVTSDGYTAAWQGAGRPADRERQIALTLRVGRSLDELTRKPLLRQSLRFMRAPARAAGMSALQAFLESGFDTFREMKDAAAFLAIVAERERRLAATLFSLKGEGRSNPRFRTLGELP